VTTGGTTSGRWIRTLRSVRPQNTRRAISHATAMAGMAQAMVATLATFRLSQTISSSDAIYLRATVVKP
jgi:hypothetical protein